MKIPKDWTEYERVHASTLSATHIHDGEEVVTGGDDGQVWVAAFASQQAAEEFIHLAKRASYHLLGIR